MQNSKSWHIVGICGIGMSGAAQMARAQGYTVSGSDRSLGKAENAELEQALTAGGIKLFPQDGSRFTSDLPRPDAVIYSSAIEEDNPDFAASQDIERIHRAAALRDLILQSCKSSIAVAGSCGKTSTTALISEALFNLGLDPECINGGFIKAFRTAQTPGNYRSGAGHLVFEADESDKSLLAFHPDYAIVLNIGTDHYEKSELETMFAQFANQAVKGAIIEQSVYGAIKPLLRTDLPVKTFSAEQILRYQSFNGVSEADFGNGVLRKLPSPGKHTALNVLAAAALLEMLGISREEALTGACAARGVARRFDYKGRTAGGAAVYDDYAHNPEKVAVCIAAAQELAGNGRVWAIFQPHGYGPFGFMQQELGAVLERTLRKNDRMFIFEPYYAGGSSSFKPHASEVIAQWQNQYPALQVTEAASRAELSKILQSQSQPEDVILIMGARDNTLAVWAQELTE